jgi:hypothetical protein
MTEKSEEVQLSSIHTPCKNCLFAMYENDKQIGCKLDRLKYHKNIIEVYDDEKTFYVVDKSFCLFYRTKELMDYLKIPEEQWESATKDQVKLPVHIILLFNKDNTHEDLIASLKALKSQYYLPAMVTVANKQYDSYTKDPENFCKPIVLYKSLVDCNFKNITFKNIYDDEIRDREIIDLVFDSTKHLPIPIYMVFNVGYSIPETFMKELDDAVINNGISLNFAHPVDEINGMVVSRVAHKKYSGNAFNVNIEDKIKMSEENLDKIIFNITDICPSIK